MKLPKNIAVSVRQRLLNRARSEKRPFNELLQYYAMERFLYRLTCSATTFGFYPVSTISMVPNWERLFGLPLNTGGIIYRLKLQLLVRLFLFPGRDNGGGYMGNSGNARQESVKASQLIARKGVNGHHILDSYVQL